MVKNNHHLPFRKNGFWKTSLIYYVSLMPLLKKITYLPTSFMKCAGLQGLSVTISKAAQKSK